jgi:acetylornithine deacetylase
MSRGGLIMKQVEIDRVELLENLQELIRINSVNPSLIEGGKGEAEIAQYIGKYLGNFGLEIRYQEIEPGRMNVIGVLKGTGGGRSLILNGHTDTVSLDKMAIQPLEPEFQDGKVYGRGSLDMKGGVAAMIAAVKGIAAAGIKLKGDVIIACVADEEYGSIGTEALVRDYTADAAIICEPSNLDICIAHKGYAWTNIEVYGRAAHGSKPEVGIDAIMKAGKVLVELEALGEKLRCKKHALLGSPSLHASLIKGGTELSTYPDYCQIQIERRSIPGEEKQDIIEEIEALLAAIAARDSQFKAALEVFFYRPHFEIAKTEAIVAGLEKAYRQIVDKEPQYMGFSAWLDSAILAQAGIPTVIFGPGGEGLHAATEYVDFDSVVKTAEVLAELILDFCG